MRTPAIIIEKRRELGNGERFDGDYDRSLVEICLGFRDGFTAFAMVFLVD